MKPSPPRDVDDTCNSTTHSPAMPFATIEPHTSEEGRPRSPSRVEVRIAMERRQTPSDVPPENILWAITWAVSETAYVVVRRQHCQERDTCSSCWEQASVVGFRECIPGTFLRVGDLDRTTVGTLDTPQLRKLLEVVSGVISVKCGENGWEMMKHWEWMKEALDYCVRADIFEREAVDMCLRHCPDRKFDEFYGALFRNEETDL